MFIPTAEIAAIWWLHGKNNIFFVGSDFSSAFFVPNTQLNVVQFLFVQIWPICGGKNLAPPPKHQELLLTGYLRKTHTHTNTQTLRHTHTKYIEEIRSAGAFSFYLDKNLMLSSNLTVPQAARR